MIGYGHGDGKATVNVLPHCPPALSTSPFRVGFTSGVRFQAQPESTQPRAVLNRQPYENGGQEQAIKMLRLTVPIHAGVRDLTLISSLFFHPQ